MYADYSLRCGSFGQSLSLIIGQSRCVSPGISDTDRISKCIILDRNGFGGSLGGMSGDGGGTSLCIILIGHTYTV